MTVTAKCLVESTAMAAAATTYYTAPSGTRTYLDKFTVANTTASPVTVVVQLVPSGQAVATAYQQISKTIAAGVTDALPELIGHVLNTGDFISINPTATGCNVRVTGREMQ